MTCILPVNMCLAMICLCAFSYGVCIPCNSERLAMMCMFPVSMCGELYCAYSLCLWSLTRSYECIIICLVAVSFDVQISYIYVLLAIMPTFLMSMCG